METALPASAAEALIGFVPQGQRILITGCHGLLGQKLTELLEPVNEVVGADLAEASFLRGDNFHYMSLDISQREAVLAAVVRAKPRFIINTAAMTDVDGCEVNRDRCWRINVLAVENLIRACNRVDAHLIQLSSDYVFDGRHPPYSENHATAPLGFYGKSKLAGENAVRGAGIPSTIVRTQVLYGCAPQVRPNFVTFILERLSAPGDVRIVDDQRGMPTLADDLASGIARLLQWRKEGIYHVCGRDSVTRRQFAQEIALQFGHDPQRLTPIKTAELKQKSPRPMDSTFSLEKIQRELAYLPRGIQEGLAEFKRQYERPAAAGGDLIP